MAAALLSSPVAAIPTATKSAKTSKSSKSQKIRCASGWYLTPEVRASQLRQLYSTVSDNALFNNPLTPQAKALDWIVDHDPLKVCRDDSSCQPLQRYILALFYFTTNGGDWDQCNDPRGKKKNNRESVAWLKGSQECNWYGVKCSSSNMPHSNKCIEQLHLKGNGLSGVIPTEIGLLGSLGKLLLFSSMC